MKRIRLYSFLIILAGIISVASCSKFDKIVKSSDYELKYTKAKYYYEKENYTNALTLFEELIPVFKGTDRAEEVYYYVAYCNYHLGDFGLAAYHFKMYVRNFPVSKHTEECAFLNAYCYYLNSPKYSLDQQDTKTAVFEMQEFVNNFPESVRIDSCNKLMDELRVKLERKAYEITKQYYFIEDWKAAIAESNNFLKEFQTSSKCEEIHFINLKSSYLLARNSIDKKKGERLDNSIESYLKFLDLYPQSSYLREAEDIYESCKKLKDELNISQKNGL
ncbi:MAG: outer rane assembly lipoprotein YfiO [Bacteroidetes bacterium]|jgi:outer membrane protein assembly factor BamD|nr:outer rane assembly lipoprotein YfiO [Bacteroidota bacterium]